MPPLKVTELSSKTLSESSELILQRVKKARAIQMDRYKNSGFLFNSEIPDGKLQEYCALSSAAEALLTKAIGSLDLSARSFNRILKLSRTIADLDNSDSVTPNHIAESIGFNRSVM